MKNKALGGGLAVMLVFGLLWFTDVGVGKIFAEETLSVPTAVVGTPMVKLDKKTAKVDLYGTGFKPGQEIRLVFTTKDGVAADISDALKPEPVPNALGQWVTSWNCTRYVARKLVQEGVYTITVTDDKFNTIVQVPVAFYAEKKK
jgi:hypothetical protein